MTRNGIRVCDLFNEVTFEAKLRKLVGSLKQAYVRSIRHFFLFVSLLRRPIHLHTMCGV